MTRIAHVDLIVASAERALEFYVGVLGCKVVEDGVVRIPSIALLTGGVDLVRIVLLQLPGPGVGKSTIELMEFQGERPVSTRFGSTEPTLPSMWSFSLVVDELESYVEGLAKSGVSPVTPIDVVQLPRAGTCRVTFIRDPDGNLIELIDVPKRSASA